jgi:copper chaperone
MESRDQLKSMAVQLRIHGMHCNSCVLNVCGAMEDLQGVINTDLTLQNGIATITYNEHVVQLDHIIAEIKKLGDFDVVIEKQPVSVNINEQGL